MPDTVPSQFGATHFPVLGSNLGLLENIVKAGPVKAGVFLWELTRCTRVKSGFSGFYFDFFRGRALTEASQHACSYACLIEEWQD